MKKVLLLLRCCVKQEWVAGQLFFGASRTETAHTNQLGCCCRETRVCAKEEMPCNCFAYLKLYDPNVSESLFSFLVSVFLLFFCFILSETAPRGIFIVTWRRSICWSICQCLLSTHSMKSMEILSLEKNLKFLLQCLQILIRSLSFSRILYPSNHVCLWRRISGITWKGFTVGGVVNC